MTAPVFESLVLGRNAGAYGGSVREWQSALGNSPAHLAFNAQGG